LKLHQNKELFQDAVLAASQRFGIPEIYVEKDFFNENICYSRNKLEHFNICDIQIQSLRTLLDF